MASQYGSRSPEQLQQSGTVREIAKIYENENSTANFWPVVEHFDLFI